MTSGATDTFPCRFTGNISRGFGVQESGLLRLGLVLRILQDKEGLPIHSCQADNVGKLAKCKYSLCRTVNSPNIVDDRGSSVQHKSTSDHARRTSHVWPSASIHCLCPSIMISHGVWPYLLALMLHVANTPCSQLSADESCLSFL